MELKETGLSGNVSKGARLHLAARYLYEVALVLYLVYQFLSAIGWNTRYYQMSSIPWIISVLSCSRYLLIPVALEKVYRSRREGLITLGCMGIAWIVSRSSNFYNNVYDFVAFLLLSDAADEERAVRLNFFTHIGCLALLAAAFVLGRTIGMYYYSWVVFGIGNPNSTAGLVLALLLLIWKLWLKQHKILTFLCFWAFIYPVEKLQASETVVVLLFLFPILWIIVEALGKSKHAKILSLTPIVPWIVMAISVGVLIWLASFETVPYWTTPPWKTFSERFGDAANLLQKHGVTWFGSQEAWTLGYTTDNLFLNMLLCHGIVALIMVTVAFSWSLYTFYRSKRYDLMTVTLLFMIYSAMEGLAITMLYNFVPVITLAGAASTESKSIRKEKSRSTCIRNRVILSVGTVIAAVTLMLVLPSVREATMLRPLKATPIATQVSEPIQPETEISQDFTTDESFQGMSILAATYQTSPRISMHLKLKDEEGNILEEQVYDVKVRDNQYLDLLFDGEYMAGNYTLSVSGESQDGAVVFWEDEGHEFPLGEPIEPQEGRANWVMKSVRQAEWKEPGKIWSAALAVMALLLIWALPLPPKQKADNASV